MNRFLEYIPTTSSIYVDMTGSYTPSSASKGELILVRQDAILNKPYVGPGIAVARPGEQSIANAMSMVSAVRWNDDIDWVFLADGAAAAATRRFFMYTFNRKTWTFDWAGSILANYVTNTGVKTIRGFRAILDRHITGTVGVSGTAVTGVGTGFQSGRFAAGARIGFGSTDPNQITTWYDISSISSETALTLSTPVASTIGAGTAYVIEEIRLLFALTNATAANGGLFLIKGLNPSTFSPLNTNIAEAAAADNIRGIYWLSDHLGTVTNTNASGMGLESTETATSQSRMCYVLNGTTTSQIFKYNIRAALTPSSGKSNAAFVLATGISPTLTGTAGQVNNARLAKTSHGPGSGSLNFYFTTGTRIYRVAETNIITGSTVFLSDNMVEIPPGGTSTYTATSALASIDYAESVDHFIVPTTLKTYVTQYKTDSSPFNLQLGSITGQIDPAAVDSNSTLHITNTSSTAFAVWTEGGILYLLRNTATVTQNQLYAIALAPHWSFDVQPFITPELTLTSPRKMSKVVVYHSNLVGGTEQLGLPPEPFKIYARTSGISDNSGTWSEIDESGDLSGLTANSSIQFKIEFKTLGLTCIPARIYGLAVLYEDQSTDSHYIPSVDYSSGENRRFAWRQSQDWGGLIPTLTIELRTVEDDTLILTDTSATGTLGTWQYSTDGVNWNSWNASTDNVGNYIRYTANSLADGINIKAIIYQS